MAVAAAAMIMMASTTMTSAGTAFMVMFTMVVTVGAGAEIQSTV